MSKQSELIPVEGEVVENAFQKANIRKILHNNEWWFSIVDIVEALLDSERSSKYWEDLKKRMKKEEGFQFSENFGKLKLPSKKDGKKYPTDCANIEGILRIIQSIPSKKAEPFKRWLARAGFERIQERQSPELAIKRAMLNYQIQGRDEKWINDRVKAILARNELTKEWENRDVKEGVEYGILTDEISKGTFGLTTKDHKDIKSLKKHHSLRDNMTSIELIFQRLGEEATIEVTKEKDSKGFQQNLESAKLGGESAGEARIAFEKKIDKAVVTSENFSKNVKGDDLLEFDENQLEKIANKKKPK